MSNTLNLNGCILTLASLALIAEMLERGGEVVVRNCAVQSDAPVSKSLGFEVFREERDGYWHTHIEELQPRKTALEFWTLAACLPVEPRELSPAQERLTQVFRLIDEHVRTHDKKENHPA